ncbi:MAG: hypothetical protein RSC92_05445, partial [Clostridia bacterium]
DTLKIDELYDLSLDIKKEIKKYNKNINTLKLSVILNCEDSIYQYVKDNAKFLRNTLNVSNIEINNSNKTSIKIEEALGSLCYRCNRISTLVGINPKYEFICDECANEIE